MASYWYSLDDVATQTRRAIQVQAGVENACPVVSGDAATDLLAPWRRPEHVTVYVAAADSLTSAGFVPVGSPTEATLTVCAAKDPGAWLPKPWLIGGLPIADPLQIAYNVATSAGAGQALRARPDTPTPGVQRLEDADDSRVDQVDIWRMLAVCAAAGIAQTTGWTQPTAATHSGCSASTQGLEASACGR